MKRWMAVVAVVLSACSQPGSNHAVAVTASPAQSAPPSQSASPDAKGGPVAFPSPIPDLPLTTVSFSCRLPIYKEDARIVDSFITFPAATVAIDPNGNNGKYFDLAYSRWLPVPRSGVNPDGAGYAYIEFTQTDVVLHVVAVASGKEVLVHLATQPFNGQPIVLDYSADGIYLVQAFEHPLAGLWLVDPATGSIRQVSKDLYPILSAGNGIIWTQVLNPADPNPVVTGSSAGTLPNEIDRVDLRSNTRTEWLYEPGKGLSIVGLDSRGLPLIVSATWGYDPNAQLLLVAGADAPRLIYKGGLAEELGSGVTDSHGTWIGGQGGIYLYTNSGALLKVSNHPGYPANGCF